MALRRGRRLQAFQAPGDRSLQALRDEAEVRTERLARTLGGMLGSSPDVDAHAESIRRMDDAGLRRRIREVRRLARDAKALLDARRALARAEERA